ncbi:Kinesin-like protein [Quillaja saponaria]|uniref:Kinesin-like protein n=1 Tax=Quillaja saponaria TaxID=32244 RepID=A0AAD7PNN3_QUISA|nr:Kinesin-like protein [Quillaja saponaria]
METLCSLLFAASLSKTKRDKSFTPAKPLTPIQFPSFFYLKDPGTSPSEFSQLEFFFSEEDNNVRSSTDYREVSPMIPGIHGCNATVFAYESTGSGNTYTIQMLIIQNPHNGSEFY